jgi:tetratricopeptide (TPR) repeat protein
LTRETLDYLAEPAASPEAVEFLLVAHSLIFPEPLKQSPSPVALSPEELQAIDRAALVAATSATRREAVDRRAELIRQIRQGKVDSARQEAEDLFQGLKPLTRQERRGLVEAFPSYWSWALAMRACEGSIRMAAHNAEEALELADLALSIAQRIPGEEIWRFRVQGYCWAHIANARRVANDHAGADEAFARAWDLWRAGAESDPELLPEWRLFSLEASLRRAQHRFSAALELLDKAQESCGGHQAAGARVLLQKGNLFEQMGDFENALAVLVKAAPLVEDSGDPRLVFGLCFDTANNLQYLGQYRQAAEFLPRVRKLALQQGHELDLLRVVWLESKVKAGQGRGEEAIAGLEQVGREFTAREMPYDAALSGLDLAVLLLKAGRTGEVKELAIAMGWIFKSQGIAREALASLQLFCDAARQEAATVELARQVIADIEQARRSAPPRNPERGRG